MLNPQSENPKCSRIHNLSEDEKRVADYPTFKLHEFKIWNEDVTSGLSTVFVHEIRADCLM